MSHFPPYYIRLRIADIFENQYNVLNVNIPTCHCKTIPKKDTLKQQTTNSCEHNVFILFCQKQNARQKQKRIRIPPFLGKIIILPSDNVTLTSRIQVIGAYTPHSRHHFQGDCKWKKWIIIAFCPIIIISNTLKMMSWIIPCCKIWITTYFTVDSHCFITSTTTTTTWYCIKLGNSEQPLLFWHHVAWHHNISAVANANEQGYYSFHDSLRLYCNHIH